MKWDEGRRFQSKNKKYVETVFFVHFYEGNVAAIRKHIGMVNDLGFDAFAFQLAEDKLGHSIPINSKKQFGLKHLYADQIEKLLNQIPGNKIVFSFSNPSAAAIEAIAARNATDIKALICDSGPSFQFIKSGENLLRWNKHYPVLLSQIAAPFFSFFWSPKMHQDCIEQLNQLPHGFPVMTLLAQNDLLIPPADTMLGFEKAKNLNWKNKIFSNTGHLQGLKTDPEGYRKEVQDFLISLATKI